MRRFKQLLTACALLFLLIIAGGYGTFLLLARPEPLPQRRLPVERSAAELDPVVGGYLFGFGEGVLVTFAADGGLQMVHLGERLTGENLVPLDPTHCQVRDRPTGQANGTITWQLRNDGRCRGLIWVDQLGRVRPAWRIGLGYRVRRLRYRSHDTPLVATLFLPDKEATAAAVMIHGSGDSDRDNLWTMTIAHRLAADGIAVLLPDKRGCGSSGGEWRTASFDLLADDTVSAVRAVRAQPEIDPAKVGLIGVSQGGWIAPLAASKIDSLAFVIDLVGTAVQPNDQLVHETRATLAQHYVPGFVRGLITPIAAEVPRRKRPKWWELNGSFDPLPYWQRLAAPALVVYGAEDEHDNVPVARSVELLKQVKRQEQDWTIKVYPNSGHGLYAPGTNKIRPDFLQMLSDWIARQGRRQEIAAGTPESDPVEPETPISELAVP